MKVRRTGGWRDGPVGHPSVILATTAAARGRIDGPVWHPSALPAMTAAVRGRIDGPVGHPSALPAITSPYVGKPTDRCGTRPRSLPSWLLYVAESTHQPALVHRSISSGTSASTPNLDRFSNMLMYIYETRAPLKHYLHFFLGLGYWSTKNSNRMRISRANNSFQPLPTQAKYK